MTGLLIGALASGVLLLRSTSDDEVRESGPRLSIGYYMDDAKLSGTDENGRILYRARSNKATQNLDDGTIYLQEVHVNYDPFADIPWDLRANTGRIPRSGNIIELKGDVVARTKDDGNESMTIRTDYMELDTETYIADTEHKVAIDQAHNRVFATGMRAYFKEDRLQLLSNVNGNFVP
jgi:lipopolysaccharide export system protein LptC